jgi:lipopolysaccharide transport system permease protein
VINIFQTPPFRIFNTLFLNKFLIYLLIKREISVRYKGSIFGYFWFFLNHLIFISIYTFVFTRIFDSKWSSSASSGVEFALILFIGLLVFNFFSECITKAPNLIASNPSYVKKIKFPVEVLPIIITSTALFNFIIGLIVWIFIYVAIHHSIHFTALLFPFILIPLYLATLGLVWVLSFVGVFIKDLQYVVGFIMTIFLFLSPVFYPIDTLPEMLKFVFMLNPLTIPIETLRDIFFFGQIPDIYPILIYSFFSLVFFYTGLYFFEKSKKDFSDVI